MKDIEAFLPLNSEKYSDKIECHYLGYYLNWIPQEAYYYSVENCNFLDPDLLEHKGLIVNIIVLTIKLMICITILRLLSLELVGPHYFSQEIRNNHISIEEGKKLIKKFDGEFPDIYFKEIMDYLNIK